MFLIYIHYPKHIQFHIIFKKDKAILQQTNNRGKSYLVRDYYIRLTKFILKNEIKHSHTNSNKRLRIDTMNMYFKITNIVSTLPGCWGVCVARVQDERF